jgi:CheY-like chemotaxis protein
MTVKPTGELFIVDDDSATRDALSVVFTLAGYRIAGFAEGESFIATARMPAGALLALHMPGQSGLAVLREINAAQFPAPIFIMSGDGDVAPCGRGDQEWRLRLHPQTVRCAFCERGNGVTLTRDDGARRQHHRSGAHRGQRTSGPDHRRLTAASDLVA